MRLRVECFREKPAGRIKLLFLSHKLRSLASAANFKILVLPDDCFVFGYDKIVRLRRKSLLDCRVI